MELSAVLDAIYGTTKSALWQLRGPIDAGRIVEGRELGRVLWSHCATFETITSISTKYLQSGTERGLTAETRSRLFSIAHNAMTNAYLHASPCRVEVRLVFGADKVELSVSDDGVGLPDDYAEHGRGFYGMRSDAMQMGGELIVEGTHNGTTITCVVRSRENQDGD